MICISENELKIVLNIIKRLYPKCRLLAFGSRYKWTNKDYSDLDLAIEGAEKISFEDMSKIKDAFEESELNFSVDIIDLNGVSKEFKEIVVSGNEEIYNGMSGLKEGWKRFKLLDCYDVTNGLSKNKEEFGFGYPFLTFKEIFSNYFLPENLLNLVNSTVKEREKCSIKRGDVFITRTSETLEDLGITAVSLKDYPNATFNGFTKRLRPKSTVEIFPEFIAFYLKSKGFRNQIQSFASLTTRASLNNEMLKKLELIIPNIQKQKEIAKILKDLYDKIELNNQMNKTLEEMAQTLFKQWFIDFEFPNEKGEPYKSSGGKMVESELGEIPEGWRVRKLGEELSCILGGTPSRSKPEYWNGNINWINSGKINEYRICKATEYITKLGLEKSATKILPKHTVVLAITGATLGQISLLLINSCANQSVIGIIENEKYSYIYIYEYIKNIMKDLVSHQTGGAQQHINKNNVENIKLLSPKIEILNEYTNKTEYIYEQIENNCFKNIVLKDIRDTLLHKLMNGEVEL